MFDSQKVQALFLFRVERFQIEEILEDSILANGFCPASPVDELKLGDPMGCGEIKWTPCVASAKRYILDCFIRLQDVGERSEDAQRVNGDIDLACCSFDLCCSPQEIRIDVNKTLNTAAPKAFHRLFNACNRPPLIAFEKSIDQVHSVL